MYPFHTGVLNKQFTVGTAVNIQFYDICTLIDRGAKGLQRIAGDVAAADTPMGYP